MGRGGWGKQQGLAQMLRRKAGLTEWVLGRKTGLALEVLVGVL